MHILEASPVQSDHRQSGQQTILVKNPIRRQRGKGHPDVKLRKLGMVNTVIRKYLGSPLQ